MEMSELFESIGEWESESEAAEAARGRGSVRKPSAQPSFKPRAAPGAPQYVTQTQLEAALARSDGKIKTVSEGVTQINTRLNSLAASARKEAEERKKSLDAQNKDINQKLQLMAMLPVLITSPTVVVNDTNHNPQNVLSQDPSSLNKLLPLLLVTGMGGTGGFGGDSSGSGDGGTGMMMMAMVLALAK